MGAIATTVPELDGSDTSEARICAAALSCIARFGSAKTTLDDIARESGVSRATIYRVFPGGRDHLFDAVLSSEVRRFFDGLASELDRCADLEDLLVTGLAGSMRFLLDHEALRTIVTLEPALLLPQLAFHRLEHVLRLATAFATPYLEPYVGGRDSAVSAAEHLVRIVLSYTLHPGGGVDPYDDASIRALVRTHVLPGLLPSTTATPARSRSHEGTTP